jgi:hypothetical protein
MPISPLAKKLQLKPGCRAALINAPAGYLDRLRPLPDGAELVDQPVRELDFVQVFAHDAAELDRHGPGAFAAVKPDGLLWVCYPKGGTKAGTDLNRDILWNLLSERGFAGVTLIAIDDIWSAMRFRPADKVGQ